MRILLIDDDVELCGLLTEFLKREGFTLECEHDGKRGLERALRGGQQIVLLDVMLPSLDGFEILRALRKESKVPVIMLTARGEDVDRIIGLELGADDYLPKPFNPRELAARIRAILRRLESRTDAVGARLEVNGIAVDPGTRQAFAQGKPVELTTFEFDILEMLLRSAGRVLSRDALMENMYNRKATPFDRSIDMHISHLRKKLETDEHPLIKTIRGVGYQFCRTPDEEAVEMKSLFAKILIWFWATLAVTIAGSGLITVLMIDSSERATPYSRITDFELAEARQAYETGGHAGLEAFLRRFHESFEGRCILTDAAGKDLLTGQNRADLVEHARDRQTYGLSTRGRVMAMRAASDGRYWFFHMSARPRPMAWFLLPQHLFMIGAAVLFCYLLAYHLTKPLRELEKAVTRFGQGDFSARVKSARGDELGQLARTFDQMAERMETLLAAERRLLLDISHELRSPLARLGVAVELARSGEDRDAALNRIQKESDRLNALVGQLLQVTRVEGDPRLLRPVPVRMDEMVAGLVDDSSIEAAARGCSLVLESAQPVTVEGDPELLRRAVENVIRNAIRYAPPETAVTVTVGRNNGCSVVAVRDAGPGVPEEALPHIFDPFYRVESDRNRASGGVGLGLSIARRAVELHKGKLTARNIHPGLAVEMELPAAGKPAARTKVPAEVHS